MNKTREIITQNPTRLKHFEYYQNILDKIDDNVRSMPDVAIESCKSLVEGISKTILRSFGVSYKDKGKFIDSPETLLKKVLTELSKYTYIDTAFVDSASGFVLRSMRVRNDRGDISHGRAVPKIDCSDANLAEFVAHTTDGMVCHLLALVIQVNQPTTELKYEDNPEFNTFLDEENLLESVSYSKALFDQDLVYYKELLNNYMSDKEN